MFLLPLGETEVRPKIRHPAQGLANRIAGGLPSA